MDLLNVSCSLVDSTQLQQLFKGAKQIKITLTPSIQHLKKNKKNKNVFYVRSLKAVPELPLWMREKAENIINQ